MRAGFAAGDIIQIDQPMTLVRLRRQLSLGSKRR